MSEPPEFWIARDLDGDLYAFEKEPRLVGQATYVSPAGEMEMVHPMVASVLLGAQRALQPGEKRLVRFSPAPARVVREASYNEALREAHNAQLAKNDLRQEAE